jgi:hypothetical protein
MTPAERTRTLNAVLYFVSETIDCTERKLHSLLYLSDVLCFQRSGQTITGMSYLALTSGPKAPFVQVWLEYMPEEMGTRIRRDTSHAFNTVRQVFRPTGDVPFDDDPFTSKHLEIMEEVVRAVGGMRGRDIVYARFDNGAYQMARGRGSEEKILMEEAVSAQDPNRAEILRIAAHASARHGYMQRAA